MSTKSRKSFITVIVILSLFLLLFSALSIFVLYIGQSIQPVQQSPSTGMNINDIITTQLSGSNLIIDQETGKQVSGQAVVLPQEK